MVAECPVIGPAGLEIDDVVGIEEWVHFAVVEDVFEDFGFGVYEDGVGVLVWFLP